MRRVNEVTLEIEEVPSKKKEEVFMMNEDGIWEGEQTHEIRIFKTFAAAVAAFTIAKGNIVSDMKEWTSNKIEQDEYIR